MIEWSDITNEHVRNKAYEIFDTSVDYTNIDNWVQLTPDIKSWIDSNANNIVPTSSLFDLVNVFANTVSRMDIFRKRLLRPLTNLLNLVTSDIVTNIVRRPVLSVRSRGYWVLGKYTMICDPPEFKTGKIIIFFHGGGYLSVNGRAYINTLEEFSKAFGCRIVMIEYDKHGDLDRIARDSILIVSYYSRDLSNVIYMADSSGTTIINRLLLLENRSMGITNSNTPYYKHDIILFYPFLAENTNLTPGRFFSILSPSLINIRFYDQMLNTVRITETEFDYIERYKHNNFLVVLAYKDSLYEDGKALSNLTNRKDILVELDHGFLVYLNNFKKELAYVISFIKANINFD